MVVKFFGAMAYFYELILVFTDLLFKINISVFRVIDEPGSLKEKRATKLTIPAFRYIRNEVKHTTGEERRIIRRPSISQRPS